MRKDYNLEKRKLVIGGFIVAIVIIYIIRLIQLQVLDSTYKANADNNAFMEKVISMTATTRWWFIMCPNMTW